MFCLKFRALTSHFHRDSPLQPGKYLSLYIYSSMSSEIHFESATVDAPIDGCNSVEPIFTFVSQKQSECEFVRIQTKDRSEIDLNECEHFNSFKVHWDQSKLD